MKTSILPLLAVVCISFSTAQTPLPTLQELTEQAYSLTAEECDVFFDHVRGKPRQEKEPLYAILLDSPIPMRDAPTGAVCMPLRIDMIDYFAKSSL